MAKPIDRQSDYPLMQSARTTTFISDYYELSHEPLNLRTKGQTWFRAVFDKHLLPNAKFGLVLGGTPWLGAHMERSLDRTIVADIAPEMLATAKKQIDAQAAIDPRKIEFLCANWLSLPDFGRPVDVVAGDNCLTFITYPGGWKHLFEALRTKMSTEGQVLLRVAAIPDSHRALSIGDIVAKYVDVESLNFTEVRAQLLFSYWNPKLNAIDTEEVVKIFDAHIGEFQEILRRGGERNDLVAIRKFRNTGFVLFAPRLNEMLRFLEDYLVIEDVSYGDYGLSEYFPLIVARVRDR